MSELLHTRFLSEMELRSDGRTIVGCAVPFGVEARVHERGQTYTEVFRKGAFAKTIRERSNVRLYVMHDIKSLPLGRATVLREDDAGLYGEFHVSATRAGDEVLELVRDGALDSFSIGFQPVPARDRWNRERTVVERTEVKLREISLVSFPAYDTAKVEAVRDAASDDPMVRLALLRRKLQIL